MRRGSGTERFTCCSYPACCGNFRFFYVAICPTGTQSAASTSLTLVERAGNHLILPSLTRNLEKFWRSAGPLPVPVSARTQSMSPTAGSAFSLRYFQIGWVSDPLTSPCGCQRFVGEVKRGAGARGEQPNVVRNLRHAAALNARRTFFAMGKVTP